MNCPECNKPMLDMPIYNRERKVMEYFLCLNCVVRVLVRCKWKTYAFEKQNMGLAWCSKTGELCRLDSDPETGYVFCPQIREWQEKQCEWVKAQNHEFEKQREEKLKIGYNDPPVMLTTPLHPKGRVLSDEEAEEYEKNLKRKKKDRVVSKYKPSRRGKG